MVSVDSMDNQSTHLFHELLFGGFWVICVVDVLIDYVLHEGLLEKLISQVNLLLAYEYLQLVGWKLVEHWHLFYLATQSLSNDLRAKAYADHFDMWI